MVVGPSRQLDTAGSLTLAQAVKFAVLQPVSLTGQSVKQSVERSIDWSINYLLSQSINQKIYFALLSDIKRANILILRK